MRILVIRFSSIGDILLTSSVPFALRDLYPNAEIVFLTKSSFVSLVQGHPAIHQVVAWDGKEGLRKLARRLGHFDLIIDLHYSLRSRILKTLVPHTKYRHFTKPYLRRFLLVHFKLNFYKTVSRVRTRYLDAAGATNTSWPEYLPLQEPPAEILVAIGNRYIAIAPGARWQTKQWPPEYFRSFLELFHKAWPSRKVVLLGGPDESETAQQVAEGFAFVVNAAGRLTLSQTFSVLSRSSGFVTGDSSLMHAGAAFNIPMVALFLSTVTEFGFEPGGSNTIVLSEKLPCKPCDHKGLSSCPQKHFRCAYLLTPEKVFAAFLTLMDRS